MRRIVQGLVEYHKLVFKSSASDKICKLTFKRMDKSSIISGAQPRSVAVGDFDNDNQIDIVVANSGTNSIGIFYSYGDGTFANQKIYSTGYESLPYAVVVNDFNNDHYPDIAVANYGNNNIGLFLGYGNGTFAHQKVFTTGSSRPLFITSADFNNDNQADIVVANNGTDDIAVLLGNGDGSFQDRTSFSTGYDSRPYSVAVGDFNKDNQMDIATTNYGTNSIGIFLGQGNGTFASQASYATGFHSNPSSVAVGDFNNDKQLDLAVANYGTGHIAVLLGHGNGSFAAPATFSTGSSSRPCYITVSHVDNDNEVDLIIADSDNDRVHILLGTGDGTFFGLETYDAMPKSRPCSIVVADINKDNRSDVLVANYGSSSVLVLSVYSSKPSVRPTNYFLGRESTPNSVAISDFNNDGYLDIVTNAPQGYGILLFTGSVNETFFREKTYATGNGSIPNHISVGDLNNDNRMDIVTANFGSNSVGVLLGQDNGIFASVMTYPSPIDARPRGTSLGDVNNDKRLDIIVANSDKGSVGVLLGHGDGTFSAMAIYSTGQYSRPYSVAVGDIDHDGQLDIVVPTFDLDRIGILFGHGDGTFEEVTHYETGSSSYPISIALADLNADSHLDIIVVNSGANNFGVFMGCGNRTFEAQRTYTTGSASEPRSVQVADFNNDQISDIAITLFAENEVVLFFGHEDGALQRARTYSTGFLSHPSGIAVADFNNDTQLDIVVALWGTRSIAVLQDYYYAAEFEKQTAYSTGFDPQAYSVAVGDFDNDHRLDIVVAKEGTNNVGVSFGFGNGTFEEQIVDSLGIVYHPHGVISEDVNKDNRLDIIAVSSTNDSVSIILGYGNGSFSSSIVYPIGNGSHPSAVAFGDFNNDNRADMVVTNEGTHSIGILLGYDYATFASQITYSIADNLKPYMIAVADFNNDGYLDIVCTFLNSNNVGIYLGCSNGSFGAVMIFTTGIDSGPIGLVVSDFNNDDQLDLAVLNQNFGNVAIFLGYGNGSFATMMAFSTGDGSAPYSITAGNVDTDSYMDLVVANYGTNDVGILLGYGNGSFATVVTYPTGDDSSPVAVTVCDFNNDSHLDIAVANYDGHNVGVLLGYGNGTFASQVTYLIDSRSRPTWLAFGDFNSDRQLDIAVTDFNSDYVGVFLGYGNGDFAAATKYSSGVGSRPFYISIGDLNNDNRSDIAVVNLGSNNIAVLFGLGNGTFLPGRAYSTGAGSAPHALAIGDFNKDKRLDIVVTNSASNKIGVFLGNGQENFGSLKTYALIDGSQPRSIALEDFNNDGQLDIVVANYGTDNVGILLGYGNGSFDHMVVYTTGIGSAPYCVAVGDLSNDNQSDILVSNSETNNLAILLGHGDGTFGSMTTYSTGVRSRPYTVVISDFNNDHILDVVVANSGTNSLLFLYGTGNGTFGNEELYPLGYGYRPYSIAVQDLNEDDWMDIVIAFYGTDNVEILLKMCL